MRRRADCRGHASRVHLACKRRASRFRLAGTRILAGCKLATGWRIRADACGRARRCADVRRENVSFVSAATAMQSGHAELGPYEAYPIELGTCGCHGVRM
ncbi:Hypothetical protein CAP_1500 [Chondromyces apiculatus DSM 436]|uniref:Uncharacterized protein n=1 Tax=Chondromyces apiculatus DSM 436 TaxID=1192034 RepID=A0A017TBY6_9BACT|nr:Hypothetical protein CAP_1500 [Chondromyces apiculatus DSM 436]